MREGDGSEEDDVIVETKEFPEYVAAGPDDSSGSSTEHWRLEFSPPCEDDYLADWDEELGVVGSQIVPEERRSSEDERTENDAGIVDEVPKQMRLRSEFEGGFVVNKATGMAHRMKSWKTVSAPGGQRLEFARLHCLRNAADFSGGFEVTADAGVSFCGSCFPRSLFEGVAQI